MRQGQNIVNLGLFHEPAVSDDPVKSAPQLLGLHLLQVRNPRDLLRLEGENGHLSVYDLVVMQVVYQRRGHEIGVPGKEYGLAVHLLRRSLLQFPLELLKGRRKGPELNRQDFPALLPGDHQGEDQPGDDQREPRPV